MENQTPSPQPTPIPKKTWIAIITLSLAGQIAWNVENTWFNTFVFDTITPNPSPVAWMVAVSAITATLTTFVMGTYSDRLGKRKPFLVIGYILWGISTAIFPTSALVKTTGLAVFVLILLDALMTFFGSTANDAVFNAWLTDVTDKSNRGKVLGPLAIFPVLVVAITSVLGGLVIDNYGYFVFFYGLGALVLLSGLLISPLITENPSLQPQPHQPYLKQMLAVFQPKTVAENKTLFLVFTATMLLGIADQINLPYLFIYLENYAGVSKTQIGTVTLVLTVITGILAVVLGASIDRWDRRKTAIFFGLFVPVGVTIFSFLRTIPSFYILGFLYIAPGLLFGIVTRAWSMDLYPEESRGRFQGVRMIFQVMLPMVIGPPIGSLIIQTFGIPTVLNGEAGFIPTPHIYWGTAIFSLLALIPVYLTKHTQQPSH